MENISPLEQTTHEMQPHSALGIQSQDCIFQKDKESLIGPYCLRQGECSYQDPTIIRQMYVKYEQGCSRLEEFYRCGKMELKPIPGRSGK